MHVQVSRAAATPVHRHGPGDALELHVLDQRLDGGKPSARGQKNHRLGTVFTQKEAAIGAFDAQNVFLFHGTEHMVGELATGHVAQVQFQVGWCALVVRRIGHRVAAAVAIAQQKLHILPGVVLERFGSRQLQPQRNHIV